MLSSVIQQAGQGPGVPGVPQLVAKFDATAQAANIGTTTLYTVPASGAGMYRMFCYVVLTQPATTSSTLPSCSIIYTDIDSNTQPLGSITVSASNTSNGLGTATPGLGASWGTAVINAKASTNIQFFTSGYVSSGATPMQYALHVKLEYLGA